MREMKAQDIKLRGWVESKKLMTAGHAINKWQGMTNLSTYDEVMQYIGLEDKNGKEIYEGDVITIEWMEDETIDIGQVIWCDAGFRFMMKDEGYLHDPAHWHKDHADLWSDPTTLNIEVFGNIYEHPELLGET